jgi:hypothetical protein
VLEKLASVRVNLLIVFLGAPLIILMIKAVSLLLPPKYYFSFSKLVAGSSEPFIVDPPGITAKKLCEVMARAAIPKSAFRGQIRTCDRDYERPISPEEMDQIYSIALRSDGEIRKAYRDEAEKAPVQPMTDDQVRELVGPEASVGDGIEAIVEYYQNEIGRMRDVYDAEKIAALFSKPIPDDITDLPPDANSKQPLAGDLVAKIIAAHDGLRTEITGTNFAQKIPPIRKSTIDELSRGVDNAREIGLRVAQYYSSQMDEAVRATVTRGFGRFDLITNRKIVFEEINKFSWTNYLLSAMVRLTPVFLFGIACGLFLGREEVLSASLAGGMAAFLLSWPLMLMWDRLVQGSWAERKWLFFAFYAVYIASFFLTARCAAVIGARLRVNLPLAREKIARGSVTWRDIAINTAGALAINAAVYAWNIYLPLSSVNAQ